MRCFKCCAAGLMTLILAFLGQAPAIMAEESIGQVVIIREAGMPDKRCVVEKSLPQPDGALLHEVRNLANGEHYRVIDHRPPKAVAHKITTSEPKEAKRAPTPAELAGFSVAQANRAIVEHDSWLRGTTSTTVVSPSSVPSVPNVISATSINWPAPEDAAASTAKHVQMLRGSTDAALRETAALALAGSESRKKTEVIDALASAAKSDPDIAVRICCVRCLCQLGKESPQVIPTIQELQSDADEKIQQIAHNALQDFALNQQRSQR